jgi:type IV pilus assembly protein PilP
MMSMNPGQRRLVGALAIAVLAGCSASQQELQEWMEQQKKEVKPNVPPLVAPRKFDPQPYTALNSVEPFSTQKLTVALKQENRQPNSLLAAELNRRKEPLEAYPLDNLSMVGSVQRKDRPYALLKADRLLYEVREGDGHHRDGDLAARDRAGRCRRVD